MNYSKVLLAGNLVRDPELKYTPNGKPVAELSVAVNDGYGEKKKVSYFDCSVWGRCGENICKFFSKGDPIFLEGKLEQQTWEDKKTGKKRSKVQVVCFGFEFCGKTKKSGGEQAAGGKHSVERVDIADAEVPF